MDILDYVIHYFDILIHPSAELAREKKNTDWREALKSFALLGMVQGLLWGIILSAILVVIGNFAEALIPPSLAWIFGLGAIAIVVGPIFGAIVQIVSAVVMTGILWLISAKLLGGKSTFTQLLYLESRLVWPTLFAVLIITVLVVALFFVSTFALFLTPLILLALIVGIVYSLYILFILIFIANDFSKLRAGISLLLYIIVIFLLNLAPLLTPGQTTAMAESNSLIEVINPTTIQGDLCDAKFGPFTVSQSSVTADTTTFVLVNQTGQPVKFTSIDVTGTNGDKTVEMVDLSVLGDDAELAPNETKTFAIAHTSDLEAGEYKLVYKITYNAGAISGVTSTGECRGTI